MISPAGTFDYTFVVPQNAPPDTPWVAQPGVKEERLVGPSPTLSIVDAGLPSAPASSTITGSVLPRVMRSRIVLAASGRSHATAARASFHVDRELMAAVRPADTLRIVRTPNCGLALSIMRGEALVAAAGAVTALSLGHVVAQVPRLLIEAALDVFRPTDPDFEFREWPIEIAVGDQRSILFMGRREYGGYRFVVEHGLFGGMPGVPECVAISRTGLVDETATIASAQLMDPDPLAIERW